MTECPVGRWMHDYSGPEAIPNFERFDLEPDCSGPRTPVALDLDSEWRGRFPFGARKETNGHVFANRSAEALALRADELPSLLEWNRSLESLLSDPRRYIEACEAHAALIGWRECEHPFYDPPDGLRCEGCKDSPVPGYLPPKLTLPDEVLGDWKAMRAEFGLSAEIGAAA